MTSALAPPELAARAGDARSSRWWASGQIWAGLSIVSMWVAVLVAAVFGPDVVSTSNNAASATSSTTVPSVVVVAICALLGTVAVAHAAFRRKE